MSAREEKREELAAKAGWLGWVFATWAGRGMLILMGMVFLLSLFLVREDRVVEKMGAEEAAAMSVSVLADKTAHSVSSLITALTCGDFADVGALGDVAGARAALEGVRGQAVFNVGREVTAMENLLEKVEELYVRAPSEGSAAVSREAGELADGLRYQLKVLEEGLREREAQQRSVKSWKVQRERARRVQAATAIMMLGFLAFLWPAWMSWQGRRKLSGQIGELERGIYGRVVATEETDDYSGLQESVNRVSESLALLDREREERLAREEKTARQLCDVLESVRIGNFDRRFDPGKESPWAAAADSLNELTLSLKEMREASDAERVLKRRSLQIPRDDFFVLEKLLRAEGGQVAGVLAEMPEDSPVRSFAEDLAAIGGGRREALEKIDERLRGIRESWNAVAGSVETREDDLEKEYEFIHETSSTVDEVSVAAKQSSQMVEYVFRASQRAMSTASEGRDLVSQSIDGMNLISEQVSAIAHHILGLSKKAQEVGNIVRAVGEVSKQTNLLALNAAIEAAGAGEHGKGFAVVAKEIRELAVKSSQSTQTIEKLIREMQDATNTAVLATEEGSKSVQSGVRTINFLNTSFGQILERSQEVVESAQQISTASQEQTTGARQVANSIGSIDKMMLASLRDLKEMKTQLGQFRELVVDLESLADTLTEERQRT